LKIRIFTDSKKIIKKKKKNLMSVSYSITQTFNCTENSQSFYVNYSGVYLIEAYGAQGGGRQSSGNSYSGYGGRGGYAAGKVNLEKDTILYIYVGCVGGSSNGTVAKGGFNGGGYACSEGYSEPGNGGGGASDVRLIGGAWDNSNGLLSRFIVAGGGGGGGEDPGNLGGYGGGPTGGSTYGYAGAGGVFGKGAHTPNDGGGGGGGWIGGNTLGGSQTIPTSCSRSDTDGGNGGSGYVYTNTSEVYNGYLVHPKYQMFDAILAPNITEGNGTVRITFQSTIIVDNDLNCKCTNYDRASFVALFNLISLTGVFMLK
jgi:hypothetical protein